MRSESRARTFTEEARRSQIMECAAEALADVGFGGTSLAEIARRAGISKGVISYYFKGKDDLLGHVLFDVFARAGAAIAERITQASDPAEALRGYVEANMSFLTNNLRDIRAVVEIAANARLPDGSLRFAAPGEDPVLAGLQQLLQAGKDGGAFGDFDPRSMAVLIRGAIDTASGRLVNDPAFDMDAYTRQLLTVIELATSKDT